MTEPALVTNDDDLELAPEALCALLRRRSQRAMPCTDRDDSGLTPRDHAEAIHAVWI